MRIILAAIVIIIGANIGISAIDKMKDIQDNRMDKFCQLDPSFCENLDPRS